MSSSEKEPASCRQVHFKIRDTVNLLLTSISAFSHCDTKQWHHLCFCTGGGVFGLRSFICGGAAAAICNNRCYQCFFWSELQLEAETCCRRSVSAAAAPFHWEVIGLFVRLNSWDVPVARCTESDGERWRNEMEVRMKVFVFCWAGCGGCFSRGRFRWFGTLTFVVFLKENELRLKW